jgi:hypothetical protein
VGCEEDDQYKRAAMELFKLQNMNQMRVLETTRGFRFLQVWPCAASVGMAAIRRAAAAAQFSDEKTKQKTRAKQETGAHGWHRPKVCPVPGCQKSACNIDKHIQTHFKVARLCLVPGCCRISIGTDLSKHIRDHEKGKVDMNAEPGK